jgi:hypothetical protein
MGHGGQWTKWTFWTRWTTGEMIALPRTPWSRSVKPHLVLKALPELKVTDPVFYDFEHEVLPNHQ